MKITNGIIVGLLIMSFGIYEAAAGNASGTVGLLVTENNKTFFSVGTINSPPSCSTINQWAIDIGTSTGTAMYAMLLTAKSLNSVLTVYGTDDCSVWPQRETVRYMYLN